MDKIAETKREIRRKMVGIYALAKKSRHNNAFVLTRYCKKVQKESYNRTTFLPVIARIKEKSAIGFAT